MKEKLFILPLLIGSFLFADPTQLFASNRTSDSQEYSVRMTLDKSSVLTDEKSIPHVAIAGGSDARTTLTDFDLMTQITFGTVIPVRDPLGKSAQVMIYFFHIHPNVWLMRTYMESQDVGEATLNQPRLLAGLNKNFTENAGTLRIHFNKKTGQVVGKSSLKVVIPWQGSQGVQTKLTIRLPSLRLAKYSSVQAIN